MRWSLLLRISVVVHLAIGALAATPPGSAFAEAVAPLPGVLPLHRTADGLVVDVKLNGRTVRAVLDTGASATVIDADLAQELGLTASRSVAVGGGGQTTIGKEAGDATLGIGPFTLTVRPLLMQFSTAGLEARAIVGRELFDAYAVELDFAASQIRILRREDLTLAAASALPLSPTGTAMLSVPIVVNGEAMNAALDLGSQTALTIPSSAKLNGGRRSTWVRSDMSGLHVYPVTVVDTLAVGRGALSQVPAIIEDHAQRPGLALVGLPVLSRFKLTLDMGAHRIWLDGPLTQEPFQRDRLGLALLEKGDGLTIVHVAANSPAEKAGFVVGQVIAKVDDKIVTRETASGFLRVGRSPVGRQVVIETRDGLRRALTAEDYY